MTAASTAPTPTQIGGNVAGQYSGDTVSTKTIDEAQYHTAPTQLFPNTVQDEINSLQPQDFKQTTHGEQICLDNTAKAFTQPDFSDIFQARMQKSVERMMEYAQVNNHFKPTISLQTVDYDDFSLKSKKEYFTVDATTLQSFKSSRALREAGITVLGMPSSGAKFELVAYDQTGRPITGSAWNDFFDQYGDIVAQEQQQSMAS